MLSRSQFFDHRIKLAAYIAAKRYYGFGPDDYIPVEDKPAIMRMWRHILINCQAR
jgi:hypothetical protein